MSRVRRGGALGLAALVAVSAACTVDDAFLEETIYVCAADADCGEGWSCVNTDPVGPRICAENHGDFERCRAFCAGRCTVRGECLRACTVGEPEACPGGTTCLTVDYLSPLDGVCYPAENPCSATEPCDAGICLGGVGGVGAQIESYCLPPPIAAGACPEGYTFLPFDTSPVCLPNCDLVDTSCPLGLGCLTQTAGVLDTGPALFSFCFPGFAGAPCDDDTNCLIGRCIEGACTLSCAEADAVSGLADGVGCVQVGFNLRALYDLRCNPASGNCEPRYELGFRCRSDAQCVQGLVCDTIPESISGAGQAFCTRECTTDGECADLSRPDRPAVCRGPATFRRCAPGG